MVAPTSTERAAEQRPSAHETLNPVELLEGMGILGERRLRELERGSIKFWWVNLATTNVPIGPVLKGIANLKDLNPPRTAHLGGGVWERIAQGGGGSVAFNNVVFQEGAGYPLIFDLNQTPSWDRKGGDTLYFPGTVINDAGEAVELPLFTVSGEPVDRREPRFAFLLLAQNPVGEVKPLTQIHRESMEELGINVRTVSDFIVEHHETVTEYLTALLQQTDPDERYLFLRQIVNRTITGGGKEMRGGGQPIPLRWNPWRKRYVIGNIEYPTEEQVVEQILRTYKIASNPSEYLREEEIPDALPILSKEALIVLIALLRADQNLTQPPMQPFYPHFHWGGFQMAGAPPKIDGYFRGSVNNIRSILSTMRAARLDIPPLFYVLLPAAPFNLWPSGEDWVTQEAMAQLIARVHEKTDGLARNPNKLIAGVEEVVNEWVSTTEKTLPYYFISRFSPYDTTMTGALPPSPGMVMPEGFDSLTFQQASLIVGCLTELLL